MPTPRSIAARATRRRNRSIEKAAEAHADAMLRELYPEPTPILEAREITRWFPVRGRGFVPRNTGEDFFHCLDRLVLPPTGRMHGVQVKTIKGAAEGRAKVLEHLVRPLLESRDQIPLERRPDLASPALPLLDVWAWIEDLGCRVWRWEWPLGAWQEIELELQSNRLVRAVATSRSGSARGSRGARRSPPPPA